MENRLFLKLGFSLLFLIAEAQYYSEQKFEIEPEDQYALVNSRVVFPCRVSNKEGLLQWTKDDFGLGIHRNLSGWDRYTMIGDDNKGDYYLQIYPVMLEDDGKYQCQVSPASDEEQEIRSKFATLTVLVPPEPPRIRQGNSLKTFEFTVTKMECISHGGRPAGAITWLDKNGKELTQGVENNVTVLRDGKRYEINSILTITPRKEDRNSTYTCLAKNAAEGTYQRATVNLDVQYPPYVTTSILSGVASNGLIPEGADVQFGCHVDANPSEVIYQWIHKHKIIDKDFSCAPFLLKNVTRKYQNTRVKCRAYNDVGKGEDALILDISYGPQFRKKPQSVFADVGDIVTLSCDVSGNPLPDISWFRANKSQVISHDKNLTYRVDSTIPGAYQCKAHVVGFADIEAEASIYLNGLPIIKSPSTQYGIKGDTVTVDCTAHSIPPAFRVMWTLNYTELQGSDYTILEESLPQGVKGTLIIRNAQPHHFGLYVCRVVNSYGFDVLEITLKPEDASWSLMVKCVVITAILLSISVVIVYSYIFYTRCRIKALRNDVKIIESQLRVSNRNLNIPTPKSTYTPLGDKTERKPMSPKNTDVDYKNLGARPKQFDTVATIHRNTAGDRTGSKPMSPKNTDVDYKNLGARPKQFNTIATVHRNAKGDRTGSKPMSPKNTDVDYKNLGARPKQFNTIATVHRNAKGDRTRSKPMSPISGVLPDKYLSGRPQRFVRDHTITVKKNTASDHTYISVDDYALDYWPPKPNPNYASLEEVPPMELSSLPLMNLYPESSFSTLAPAEVPIVTEMDPKLNGISQDSDLTNLELGLPKPPIIKPKPSVKLPSSPYVCVGLLKKKGLETILE